MYVKLVTVNKLESVSKKCRLQTGNKMPTGCEMLTRYKMHTIQTAD